MVRTWWWLAAGVLVACGGDKEVPTGDDDDVTGDDDDDDDDDTTTEHTGVPLEVPNYSDPGIYGVQRVDDTVTSGACTTETATWLPDGVAVDQVVVIAHNSLRTQESFADLASHLASWGVPVVTVNLCNSGLGALNIAEDDAADLVALAGLSGATQHLYLGHVTGGIRALLAANLDPNAVAVIGLDLADEPTETPALNAAPSATVPVLGLTGISSTCNVLGNGAAVYDAASDGTLYTVNSADTCDFEWPTDDACRAICARPQEGIGEGAVQRTIQGMVTAGVVWQLGLDPLGEQYWASGGVVFEDFVASGALTP
jgi:hypothetical protein